MLSASFMILVNSFITVPVAVAQETQSNAQVDKFTTCLKNRIDPKTGKPYPDTFSLTWHDPPSAQSLKTYLTGNFHPNSTVYAIACKGSDAGKTCSTGNRANDNYLFFSDLEIQNSTGQKIIINEQASQNTDLTKSVPVKFYTQGTATEGSKQTTDTQGVVNYDAVTYGTTVASGAYNFYGIEIRRSENIDYGVFEEGGQQQGTFEFAIPEADANDCARISWTHHDPYGIVFDAKSLEPLSGVTVTILDKNGKKVQYPGFVNDIKTGVDGVFNYSVQAGVYTLVITPPATYRFETDPVLHPNTENVYVFQDTNGSRCSLYRPGTPIKEIIDTSEEEMKKAPDPECRNIALTPLGAPYVAPEVTSMFYDFSKNNLVYTFNGKVSHPLTLVSVEQDGQQLGSQKANNSGFYNISVPVSVISANLPIEIVFTKANLTATFANFLKRLFKIEVNAATSGKIVIDPVLSHIEGYAYDTNKQIIPNALVKLRIKKTGGVYFETKADEKGYFVIDSSNIPMMEYEIEFADPGTNIKLTYHTYEFAKSNSDYLKENKINLITATKDGQKIVPKGEIEAKNAINPAAANKNNESSVNSPKMPINSLVITGLVLVLLVGAAATLLLFLRQRNRQQL